jgi:uncharacterized protein (TIGR02588 family)
MASKVSRRLGNDERTKAELVTLAISIVLLVALVGGLFWLDLRGGDEPARISTDLHFSDAYQHDGAWYLPVTITNDGDRATDQLQVDIVRPIAGEQPETSSLEYTFVAGGEQVEGTAVFDEEPTPDTIEVDVLAITEP